MVLEEEKALVKRTILFCLLLLLIFVLYQFMGESSFFGFRISSIAKVANYTVVAFIVLSALYYIIEKCIKIETKED